MQLTKHTDYAFRVLIYLASRDESERVTIQEITDVFEISRSHLMKVVQKLAAAGLVTSIRGQGGGLVLKQEQRLVTVRRVVELMEATLDPVNCDTPPCLFRGACELKGVLWTAQSQYLDHLGNYTLADLVKPASKTYTLLAKSK